MQSTDSTLLQPRASGHRASDLDLTETKPSERVLYLTDLLPTGKFGSMEEQIFTLTNAFRDRGGFFLPVFGGDLSAEVANRYQSAGLPVSGLNLHSLSIANLLSLLSLVRINKITTVHWNFYSPINPFVWLLSILTPSVRHYLTDHTSRELPLRQPRGGPKKWIKKFLFKRYQKVWCISDFVTECLKHDGTWSNLHRCTYFINTERFRPDDEVRIEMRERLGASNSFIVLFVAHVTKVKGGDVAIRAMAALPDTVKMWFVGEGADLERIKSISEELSLSDRIQFLGRQSHVEPFMQAADCFICPSLWGEATGLVNLEAQASGLPVVASFIGGIPEFIDHGKTGFLFSPGDDRSLAQYLRMMVEDRELHQRFSITARKMAVEKYSIERRLNEYLRAYDR